MPKLSSNQLQEYNDNGYVAPINIFSKNEAIEIRKEIELIKSTLFEIDVSKKGDSSFFIRTIGSFKEFSNSIILFDSN